LPAFYQKSQHLGAVNHFFAPTLPNLARERGRTQMGTSLKSASILIGTRLAAAAGGDMDALFDLGIAYSSGADGFDVDLVEAHKWFNLAALSGSIRGQECRAEIAEEMTAREIVEAQKQARAWLALNTRRAA
jgi:TPR repeat protein